MFAYRSYIDIMYSTSVSTTIPPEKRDADVEAKEYGFVWVDAAPEYVTGEVKEIAEKNNVSPARTAGFWYGQRGADGKAGQNASINERVIYHFHGMCLLIIGNGNIS